jgi:hypothetical protein
VLVDIAEYEDLTHSGPDLKAYLTAGPHLDDLELDREPPRERAVDLE